MNLDSLTSFLLQKKKYGVKSDVRIMRKIGQIEFFSNWFLCNGVSSGVGSAPPVKNEIQIDDFPQSKCVSSFSPFSDKISKGISEVLHLCGSFSSKISLVQAGLSKLCIFSDFVWFSNSITQFFNR